MLGRLLYPDTLPTWALFAELALASMVVILAGCRFTKDADQLADKLQISGGWIGLILLATVTSLPELITGSTATALGNVDLALGGILGSCSFNVTLIFLVNSLSGGGSVLCRVSPSHALTSSFGLALIGLVMVGIVLMEKFGGISSVPARIGELLWASLIAATYIGCMRLIYRFERRGSPAGGSTTRHPVGRRLIVRIVVAALIIVAASWWLARLGDVLSDHKIEAIGRPLGATFVGACFLAISSSLPEITTSIAAVRLGNIDLALGNIFGSNMFNICVIPVIKIVSLAGGNPLLLDPHIVSAGQSLLTGLTAMLLTSIAMAGLTYKSSRRMLRRFGFDSILILIIYIGGMTLLLLDGSG